MEVPHIRLDFLETFDRLKRQVSEAMLMPLRQDALPGGFRSLEERVRLFGTKLDEVSQRSDARRYKRDTVQWAGILDDEEHRIMRASIPLMLDCVERGQRLDSDPLPPQDRVFSTLVIGERGAPRYEFDHDSFREALQLRSASGVSKITPASARTVRRYALKLGLAFPEAPVFLAVVDDLEGRIRVRNPESRRKTRTSGVNDDELDARVRHILSDFPQYGRRMIMGRLRQDNVHINEDRVRRSLVRVRPVPRICRHVDVPRSKVYRVAGPNSLWHHDGQHGECAVVETI